MVEIQKAHPGFVPLMDCRGYDDGFEAFKRQCYLHATTELGLEVCALWDGSTRSFVQELLGKPNCNISTLDFSNIGPLSADRYSEILSNNSSVKSWRGCPMGWPGLNHIGPHVRELQLCQVEFESLSPEAQLSQWKQLQDLLEKGNIEKVGSKAGDSAQHLLLAKIRQSAKRNGGRVREVQLRGVPKDVESASEILKVLLESTSSRSRCRAGSICAKQIWSW